MKSKESFSSIEGVIQFNRRKALKKEEKGGSFVNLV